MSEAISGELYFFLQAVLTGVILSVVYDLLRIIRRVYTHGCTLVAFEDLCYCFGGALYISYVLMRENNGVIRWFFVLGIFLGMLVYNLTIGHYIVGILSKIINKILNVVKKVLKVVCKPVLFLWKKAKKISKKAKKALKKSCKTIKIGVSKK